MFVNTQWLLEYLEPTCPHDELVRAFAMIGLEVEEHFELQKTLRPVRIGFVRAKEPLHDDNDMVVCQIETEKGRVIPVVCTAEHEIQVGWGVPVAPIGTRLPSGRRVTIGEFDGVRSEAMVCLDGDMGLLARDSGLQIFDDEHLLGAPLPTVIEIPESLVELSVLPNRPDCLGLIGIAREVAALLDLELRLPATPAIEAVESTAPPVVVELQEPQLCPRYTCQLIRAVQVGSSPPWLKARLLVTRQRPINNIVDVTNYVLYEYGQPLHAFDFQKLEGGKIVVRKMKDGEQITLLTGKVIDASRSPLVIADRDKPVALAGIMGDLPSQTSMDTQDVLLEAAYFDPVGIHTTVRETDVGTEAGGTESSYRFERGTDPNTMLTAAANRACNLLTELGGGHAVGPRVEAYPNVREPVAWQLSTDRFSSYLGMPVTAETIRDKLNRLGMDCNEGLQVSVPTWRADVNDPVVLIEDVARLIGYDKIPSQTTPSGATGGTRSPMDRLRETAARFLSDSGCLECRHSPLESPDASAWLNGDAGPIIQIVNSATTEMSVLRRSLLSSLLKAVGRNLRRGATAIRIFEIDRTFRADAKAKAPPTETWTVAAIAGGDLRAFDWRNGIERMDFYHMKGLAEAFLEHVGAASHTFDPVCLAPFRPGSAATIGITPNQRPQEREQIGTLGELDRQVVAVKKLPFSLFAFELDLGALETSFMTAPQFHPLTQTPAVTRDLAIVVRQDQSYASIEQLIRQTAGSDLESLRCVDLYRGKQVESGRHSLAFRLIFRARPDLEQAERRDRTLTAEEVSATMDRIVEALKREFKAELRA